MEVLLGVTGCIGAYKVPELVRLLRAGGAGVTVVLTRSASWFVTEGTLQTLSQRPVYGDMFRPKTVDGIEHIDLARRADLLLVAPATANTLARFAGGLADDLLSTIYLASDCPVMVAPAMNIVMYQHPAVQANLEILRRRGVEVVGPETGDLACGESGPGRLLEPADIARRALAVAGGETGQLLAGLKVVVSSGPTREPLDEVRFLSNPATGRM
ncbi:MAG: bifunctional phosphopantothenoylcysteine decarboxylase/phosphopantothenate--cysteine ligase CoaBC, partial [Acidobacteria bacterium]|nr:bifunctional phosphopantothenoylcysteine decarboxylase/phosphopantothenate--cysteine ligase CoaBC [Acidobacteriota bacterium]